MPGVMSLTGYVARKQLRSMIEGQADFVALRMDKLNPDDLAFFMQTHSLPEDAMHLLKELLPKTEDPELWERLNSCIEKYSKV